MRCRDYEKWVSDSLDGVLGEEQSTRLERHLKECPSCRGYSTRLARIQQEAAGLRRASVGPSYWEELSSAVRRRLASSEKGRGRSRPFWWNWRWAWGAAILLMTLAVGLILRPRPAPVVGQDIFTFEACLGRLSQEIGDDAALARNFNLVLWNSLRERLSLETPEESPVFSEDPLFWEGLSEEEWQVLEEEFKKELKS